MSKDAAATVDGLLGIQGDKCSVTHTAVHYRHHHELPVHEVLLLLATHAGAGLSGDEAEQRLGRYGPNVLPRFRRHGPLIRFLLQFHHPLIYVLLAAAGTTALLVPLPATFEV